MQREVTTDLVVLGGDLPALLLALRLLKRGYGVLVLADEIGGGAFGRGPGVLSAHDGYDAHTLEQDHGLETAREFLAYRQFVLDELDQDLESLWRPHTFSSAVGGMVAHDPYAMLILRNQHEALNRHGALRHLENPPDGLHPSARLFSRHADDRVCEPGSLCHSLAQAISDLGGTLYERSESARVISEEGGVRVETDDLSCRARGSCSFEASSGGPRVIETLVETKSGDETRASAWYRNQYPMSDFARVREDGSRILWSHRSWAMDAASSAHPRDDDLLAHRTLEPRRTWQRSLLVFEEPRLPSTRREGNVVELLGVGQADPVLDLIAADLALRELLGLSAVFSGVLETLPQAESRQGILSHMALQAFLDTQLADDTRARTR